MTATLTRSRSSVERGHVAAWVGVGAPGEGPRGTNEWLQIGLNRIAGRDARLYYEIVQPWGTRYVELGRNISAGRRIQVSVLEMARRRDVWRVWVDARPASKPIYLPASHHRLTPMAMAENWDGGKPTCNRNKYRFAVSRLRGAREARGRRCGRNRPRSSRTPATASSPPRTAASSPHRAAAGGRTDHTVNGSIGPDAKARIRQLLLRSFSAVSLKYGLDRISLAAARLENLLGSHPGKGRFLAGPSGCVAATPLFGARGRPLQAFRR